MNRHSILIAAFVFGISFEAHPQSFRPTGEERTLQHESGTRRYRIHVPTQVSEEEQKRPLVICLHGGGSTADTMSKAGWTSRADKDSFLVVYPEGLNRHWNDGRGVRKHAKQNAVTDDVDFLISLLDVLVEEEPVDPSRVYLVGLSNGGFMVQRLANEKTERFAAAAVVIASLPSTYRDGTLTFAPKAPLSVLFMNGTEDPFMPYQGGKLTPNLTPRLIDSKTFDFGQGHSISTDEAVALWVEHNGLDPNTMTETILPDTDAEDGCRVTEYLWQGEKAAPVVALYKVENGGHTIPGGTQYLPANIIGPVCNDVDGIETIWKFFETKVRK